MKRLILVSIVLLFVGTFYFAGTHYIVITTLGVNTLGLPPISTGHFSALR